VWLWQSLFDATASGSNIEPQRPGRGIEDSATATRNREVINSQILTAYLGVGVANETAIIPVAIALVRHGGCYLVGRRGPDGPLAGYYEFPGGKCQPNESPESCAVRECREETGLEIDVVRLRRKVTHAYPYATVALHFFDCRILLDSPQIPVAGNFFWAPLNDLRHFKFPDPNGPVIEELLFQQSATGSGDR
jgi:8-oxo-dGTP diphosphatase